MLATTWVQIVKAVLLVSGRARGGRWQWWYLRFFSPPHHTVSALLRFRSWSRRECGAK
jgi:hypothetical protein